MQELLINKAGADFAEEMSTNEEKELTLLPRPIKKLKHGDVIMVDGEKKRIVSRQGGIFMAFPLLHEDEKDEEWNKIPIPVVSTRNNNKSIKELLSTLSQDIKNRTITNGVKMEKW